MTPIDETAGENQNLEYLEQLLSLGQTLNSSLKLDEVLNIAVDSVVDFVNAERGFIMLFNEKGQLELKAYKNVDRESIQRMEGISKTILNAAAREGRNILSINAQADPRFKNVESVMLSGMRSVICVPMFVQDRIIGIIYLDNRVEEGMFNTFHLNMLEAFANQAAGAIENARLHENLIRSYEEKIELTRKLHQQEKMRLASEEASKMKSEFVNIVSHELRSPLTVIKTYTSTLHRDAATGRNSINENMKMDIYKTIDREVDRLLSMINKLLDVSRLDAGKNMPIDLRETDVNKIVDNVIKLQSTSRFFKKGKHHIVRDVPDDLPKLICDREKLSQIMMNLVENALKYSPDGGEVRIKIRTDDDIFRFWISDEGIGISPEDQEKLFKKYERFDESGRSTPGTGLGLYLVKNLVDLHNGRISAFSHPGEGSTFTFEIPRNPTKEEASEDPREKRG